MIWQQGLWSVTLGAALLLGAGLTHRPDVLAGTVTALLVALFREPERVTTVEPETREALGRPNSSVFSPLRTRRRSGARIEVPPVCG